MKQIKYLNVILTIMTIFLGIIVLAITGLIPTASAKEPASNKFVQFPLNKDGSITVRLAPNETIDVNIDEVGGFSTFGKVPVKIEK